MIRAEYVVPSGVKRDEETLWLLTTQLPRIGELVHIESRYYRVQNVVHRPVPGQCGLTLGKDPLVILWPATGPITPA